MKCIPGIALIILLVSCKNNTESNRPTIKPWYDSIPFGTVQLALEANAHGEQIKRIDSLVQEDASYTIHYMTDKGHRNYHATGRFTTLVVKGYKADGSHSCVGERIENHKTVSYCYDSDCTIVIDSIVLNRKVGPYPVLHPEKDSACIPCPPLTQKN